MRDEGGYHTTHAIWALTLAKQRGCTLAPCLPALLKEVEAAQPDRPGTTRSLDLDLYAERLLVTCMAKDCRPAHDAWAAQLITRQDPDGSWGVAVPGEDPYHRYHATMIAAWALALWETSPH